MSISPRAVVVHRQSEWESLLARHGTRGQVAFFLSSRGRAIDEVTAAHDEQAESLRLTLSAIPADWRRVTVERGDLHHFVFGPEDVVVAVGQDGLVANVAKYLDGQPVIGIDSSPGRNAGVLVTHHPVTATAVIASVASGTMSIEERTMVTAELDDGQTLTALNELFVGHPSHQSARYRITVPGGSVERQSSSGVLVGTGTGSTGWCASVWLERHSSLSLPAAGDARLCWFVREAWPSPATGTEQTEGLLGRGEHLTIVAESDLVVFGDGIESDRLELMWGQSVTLSIAGTRLKLVR